MNDEGQNSGLPPEIELGIRLESIFMPHAREQRDEAIFKKDVRFVHYTSAEAALSIIRTKRIWMRNAVCMADYSEVKHGFEILRRYFSEKSKLNAFIGALDDSIPGVALEAIQLFNQWWNPGPHSIPLNTYISSISEHDDKENLHGRLSMWRAFGGSTGRVAIVLKLPKFSGATAALNIIFSPVAYLAENEAHAVMDKVVANISKNRDFLHSVERPIILNTIFNMLLVGATCLKHEGFHEEREWRAIYSPKLRPSNLMECSTELISGIPQRVYKLPLDETVAPALIDLDTSRLFDRLIIGPSPYPWPMYEAFVAELTEAGVPNAENRVWISNIPIRA